MINIRLLMILLVLFEVVIFSHDNSDLIKEIYNSKQDVSKSTKILSPLISPTPIPAKDYKSKYFYPGSDVILSTSNTFVFESNENPQKIIDWYRSIILKPDIEKKTFTETHDLGTTKSKLVAKINNKKIMISINKKSDEKKTIIGLVISDNLDF